MTDDAFAALESRLAPVLSVPGRGHTPGGVFREDVPALLAECRALRAFAGPALAALEQVSWVFETLDNLRAEAGPDGRLATKLRHHLAAARGHLLAALEVRPPGVEAGHEAGDRRLDRVMADGAELERLRRPPDVAGLMPAAELGRLRAELAGMPLLADARPLLAHADALSALARELYSVVADLHADDPGRQALLERGRAEGRAQVWKVMVEHGTPLTDGAISAVEFEARHGKGGLGDVVRALGPSRPPLPPHESEREAGRLREVLREIAGMAAWRGGEAAVMARKALGEDAP